MKGQLAILTEKADNGEGFEDLVTNYVTKSVQNKMEMMAPSCA